MFSSYFTCIFSSKKLTAQLQRYNYCSRLFKIHQEGNKQKEEKGCTGVLEAGIQTGSGPGTFMTFFYTEVTVIMF